MKALSTNTGANWSGPSLPLSYLRQIKLVEDVLLEKIVPGRKISCASPSHAVYIQAMLSAELGSWLLALPEHVCG